ncbi:amidohydrolase family protein [bacterium]|nr:amidohydrolase family protein [bacterium]
MGKNTILIHGGRVRTMDAAAIYDPGFVLVEGAEIASVGPGDQHPMGTDADLVIDATGCVVMPGLINMHQHHWYTLLKGQGLGMYLEDWLERILLPAIESLTPDDLIVSMHLAAAEMLLSGTTTFFNHSVANTTTSFIDDLAGASNASGIRQVFGKEVRAVGERAAEQEEQALDELLTRYSFDGGRFSAALVVETGAHWLQEGVTDEATIRRAHRLSRRHGVPVSDHITGGTVFRSVSEGWRSTGQGDVDRLGALGALDHHTLLVHAVWITPSELRMAAEAHAHIVTCPASSAFTAGGSPPIRDFLDAPGLNVCLGTDGPMVNDSVDLLEQLRTCMRLGNTRYLRPDAVEEHQLPALVTTASAKALGRDDIGILRAGAIADITVFDQQGAHYGGNLDPDRIWLTAGSGRDVKWVVVDGNVVVSPAGIETIDLRNVRDEAREHSHRLWRDITAAGGSRT